MFFLVLESRFNESAIKGLEITMIGLGMERNPAMRNVMNTKSDEINVVDVLGTRATRGPRLKAARALRKALDLAG